MTCIVGVAHGGQVIIGGDSFGGHSGFGTHRADTKVFFNGPYLIGYTSSFRMGQVLRFAKLPLPQDDLYRFMCTKFIDAVRKAFKNAGIAKRVQEEESCGTFLVGYKHRLFEVWDDYQVGECLEGYIAVGSGIEVATGALYALKNAHPWNPHDEIEGKVLVEMALEAAKHHVPTVDGPFRILSTK